MVQQIWASRVLDFIENNKCLVVDVRDNSLFRQGHLPKAVRVDCSDIENGIFQYDKSIPIIVYCSEGSESIRMSRLLSMRGYYVYNLAGGYEAYIKNKKA